MFERLKKRVHKEWDSARSTEKGVYITDHPVVLGLGISAIISPTIFLLQPNLYSDLSISFLPGELEVYWCLTWLLAGFCITTGIFNYKSSVWSIPASFLERYGYILLSSVFLTYSIAVVYNTGNFKALIILSVIPTLAFVLLIRSLFKKLEEIYD